MTFVCTLNCAMAVGTSSLSIPVGESVLCLAFSPHQSSSNLLAVGKSSNIAVQSVSIKDDDEGVQGLLGALQVESVLAVLHNQADHISWSPATSPADGQYRFCASDRSSASITVFSATEESSTTELLEGHKGAVNDLCTHPHDEALLASVGDDCVCKIWDLQQGQLRSEFKLRSPGMSVKWHDQDPVKLLVAERSGRVRVYDVASECPLQSLDCPTPPLISADWAPSNHLVVGGVAGGSWFRWDLSQSSQPLEMKTVHRSPICKFSWCVQSDQVFATLTAASHFRIHHLSHQRVPVSCDFRAATDLSWHSQIPLVGVASDRDIKCWVIET